MGRIAIIRHGVLFLISLPFLDWFWHKHTINKSGYFGISFKIFLDGPIKFYMKMEVVSSPNPSHFACSGWDSPMAIFNLSRQQAT